MVQEDRRNRVIMFGDTVMRFGLPTAFTITRYKNGDMVSQRYLVKVSYNEPLPPSLHRLLMDLVQETGETAYVAAPAGDRVVFGRGGNCFPSSTLARS